MVDAPDYLRRLAASDSECPYIDGNVARMPLWMPLAPITGRQLDELLELGFRRSGVCFYKTACPSCQACEPTRVAAHSFAPSNTQRRVFKRGVKNLRLELQPPTVDQVRVDLFNKHRESRGLDRDSIATTDGDYKSFLVASFCQVLEFSFWDGDQLVAVSISDVGESSISAVYCFFDPDYASHSPGTLSIMTQIDFVKQTHRKWLYLGMFVRQNSHLNYKSRYGPQERLIEDQWQFFDREYV